VLEKKETTQRRHKRFSCLFQSAGHALKAILQKVFSKVDQQPEAQTDQTQKGKKLFRLIFRGAVA
jgi:hypothetical protein